MKSYRKNGEEEVISNPRPDESAERRRQMMLYAIPKNGFSWDFRVMDGMRQELALAKSMAGKIFSRSDAKEN
jgi:hypothetical protein